MSTNVAIETNQEGQDFRTDVLAGLSRRRKVLSCRWLYDRRGSELFEAITQLPQYYPSRVETAILREKLPAIVAFCSDPQTLVEYGAGAAIKTEILISALSTLRSYVPVDIAEPMLAPAAARISIAYPGLKVCPIVSDFTTDMSLPAFLTVGRTIAFFPGSTLGNMDPAESVRFLARVRGHVGPSGAAIIGVDLKKDVSRLLAAYDDDQNVTAEFNLNLLNRINRELDGNFRLEHFRHEARWNEAESAVEMHLVSLRDQVVHASGVAFGFAQGETIHTETSRKYDLGMLDKLAQRSGWHLAEIWTDAAQQFAVLGLQAR